jgi:hypothetical protein
MKQPWWLYAAPVFGALSFVFGAWLVVVYLILLGLWALGGLPA